MSQRLSHEERLSRKLEAAKLNADAWSNPTYRENVIRARAWSRVANKLSAIQAAEILESMEKESEKESEKGSEKESEEQKK